VVEYKEIILLLWGITSSKTGARGGTRHEGGGCTQSAGNGSSALCPWHPRAGPAWVLSDATVSIFFSTLESKICYLMQFFYRPASVLSDAILSR
jgi:hypothetical protein